MNFDEDNKLDNPAWYSLSETHKDFAVDYSNIKFYHPDYCMFGGWVERADTVSSHIDSYAALAGSFFIIGERPALSPQLKIDREIICLQMIASVGTGTIIKDEITALGAAHAESLYELVSLVQPGYFKRKTALLGNYFGIFKDEELVAVTGERMKMNSFTEVSAVVTLPGHTGKGYAKQLLAHTVNNIFSQHKTPYLHVIEDNAPAIKLYRQFDFITRRKISFWQIVRKN